MGRVASDRLILLLNYLQIFILFFTQSLKNWQISQKVKIGGTMSTKKGGEGDNLSSISSAIPAV